MPKLLPFLLCALLLASCSTTAPSSAVENPEYYAALSEEQAEGELEKVLKEINELDGDIRRAQSRVDVARSQNSRDAADNAEAALADLQSRKGGLIQRQVQLEKRLRDFQTNKY